MFIDIQEIFGSHYQLPDLGPLGGHGLANPRDFETPVASFDIDQSPWESEWNVPNRNDKSSNLRLYSCLQVRARASVLADIDCVLIYF